MFSFKEAAFTTWINSAQFEVSQNTGDDICPLITSANVKGKAFDYLPFPHIDFDDKTWTFDETPRRVREIGEWHYLQNLLNDVAFETEGLWRKTSSNIRHYVRVLWQIHNENIPTHLSYFIARPSKYEFEKNDYSFGSFGSNEPL
ncbi:hypothetical protein IAD21_05892 [Abditibacteriota bacterium]|nr:hypothetical protein IAD21_05892 [Abditibacteriota bacterium]